jgi:NAD(P)-dependent dehydrogenase (short-subunit alcohol dehydrogenase family)
MKDQPMQGKVALVAGASKGIGAVTARAFAAAGAAVVLGARDLAALESVAAGIVAEGGRAVAVRADVADVDSMRNLVGQAMTAYGRLDMAFNNASGGPMPAPLAEIDPAEFDQGIRVNVVAPGPILTYHLEAAGPQAQRLAGLSTPMRRTGTAEEVARTVLWLCSEESSFITGAVIPVDGGQMAGNKPPQMYRQGQPMQAGPGDARG